jgi:hypothetical protein
MEILSRLEQIRKEFAEQIDKAGTDLKSAGERATIEMTTKLDELKSEIKAIAGKTNTPEGGRSRAIAFFLALLLAAATAFFGAAAGAHFAGRDVEKNAKAAARAVEHARIYGEATNHLVTLEHGLQGFFISSGSVDNKFELAAAALQRLIDSKVFREDGNALNQYNDYVLMNIATLRTAGKPWEKTETDKIQREASNLFVIAQDALEHWFRSDRDK